MIFFKSPLHESEFHLKEHNCPLAQLWLGVLLAEEKNVLLHYSALLQTATAVPASQGYICRREH